MRSDRSRAAADSPPVLPRWLRRPAAGAATLAGLALVILAVRYGGNDSASHLDRHLDSAADRLSGFPLTVVQQSVVLGSPALIGVLSLISGAVALAYGHRRLALLTIFGPVVTGLATVLLKPVVDRTIEGEFAYPSGHTGGATALGLVVALVVVNVLRLGRVSGLMTIACGVLLLGGGVGAAVTVLQWHYPTDAVGGFCTALVCVYATALTLDGLADRRTRVGGPRASAVLRRDR